MKNFCKKCGLETEEVDDLHCRKILATKVKGLLKLNKIDEAEILVLRTCGDKDWEKWKFELFARFSLEPIKLCNQLKSEMEYKKRQQTVDTPNVQLDRPIVQINTPKTPIGRQLYKQVHKSYIDSNVWKNKKVALSNIYEINNWPTECLKCGTIYNLQCHHNYYIDIKYLGLENLSDIDYLCTRCHDAWHYIQKTSILSQNKMFNQYYSFIFISQKYSDFFKILNLVSQKNKMDAMEISNYFSREDVIRYKKTNDKAVLILVISFILLSFGVGIITMIVAFIIFSKNKEPKDYDLYEQRKIPIEKRKTLLAQLSTMN